MSNEVMKPTFLLLMLFCGLVANSASREATAQTPSVVPNSRPQKRKVSETVQLTTRVLNQQYCTQIVDPQNRYTKLRLKLKLTLRNLSNEPLIIHRYGGHIYRVLLSKSLAKAQAKRHLYDEQFSIIQPYLFTHRDFPEATPTDEFLILKPNEFHEYEYESAIDISLTDLAEPAQKLRHGDYLLEIKIETWQWPIEKAEELQQRWAKYGYFWYYDVKSLPMPLRIEKQNLTTDICQP